MHEEPEHPFLLLGEVTAAGEMLCSHMQEFAEFRKVTCILPSMHVTLIV